MRLPCENDQAKLDHFSRLACSTNLSKILKVDPPKRGLWIEARTVTSGCPRTCCAWLSLLLLGTLGSGLGHFCANLLNLSNFHLSVKLNLFLRFGTIQPLAFRRSPHSVLTANPRSAEDELSTLVRSLALAQNIKDRPASQPAKNSRAPLEPLGLSGEILLGRAMACSL
jgi:hypothetical protein